MDALASAAASLDLGPTAVGHAEELFLTVLVETDLAVRPAMGASLYAASLIAGEHRSQAAAADAVGVSRITVQNHWRRVLEVAGMEAPNW